LPLPRVERIEKSLPLFFSARKEKFSPSSFPRARPRSPRRFFPPPFLYNRRSLFYSHFLFSLVVVFFSFFFSFLLSFMSRKRLTFLIYCQLFFPPEWRVKGREPLSFFSFRRGFMDNSPSSPPRSPSALCFSFFFHAGTETFSGGGPPPFLRYGSGGLGNKRSVHSLSFLFFQLRRSFLSSFPSLSPHRINLPTLGYIYVKNPRF